ncbi:MAG: M23 family metallopeptidase [Cyanobacteria bacterium P01_H01_bin.74]
MALFRKLLLSFIKTVYKEKACVFFIVKLAALIGFIWGIAFQDLISLAQSTKSLKYHIVMCESLLTSTTQFYANAAVKQGEILRVDVKNATCTPNYSKPIGKVSLAGKTVRFFGDRTGHLMAIMPVSVFKKPGNYTLTITNPGGELVYTQPVNIIDARYKVQNIWVKKSTAGLKPLPGELETIGALKKQITNHRYWSPPFITPTPDCENSPFGVKRRYNGKLSDHFHKGVDLRSPAGRPVKATNAGKVMIAKNYRLHGGTVGIDHGHGLSSIYIHLSKILTQPGSIVKKGQVIGHVGSTGFASGPHLHWGLYVNGFAVNPNQWLPSVKKCY